ncbi:MAG: hypothetical protein R8K20_03745, partial [Gallionellaceae bacterium]
MKLSKLIQVSVLTAMLTGASTVVFAVDICKNVKFQFTNQRASSITVTSFKYRVRENNSWQRESI